MCCDENTMNFGDEAMTASSAKKVPVTPASFTTS
jgi:hypothetical protein